jgi:hypothetical protein
VHEHGRSARTHDETHRKTAEYEFAWRHATVPDTGASTVCRLGETPVAARDLLLSKLDERRIARAPDSGSVSRPLSLSSPSALW